MEKTVLYCPALSQHLRDCVRREKRRFLFPHYNEFISLKLKYIILQLSQLSVQLLRKRGIGQKFPPQLKVYVLFVTNCISRLRGNRIIWTSIPIKGNFLNWQMKKFTDTKLAWPSWLQTSDDHQCVRHTCEGP